VAHILVVDDDEAVTGTFVRMLRTEGHQVTAVADPGEGLNLVLRQPPDAVLLDMRMPGIGGLDFLRKLRGDPQGVRLPVGIVTGDYFIRDEVLRELEGLGAVIKYKPLWMADLSALLQQLLAAQPIVSRDVTTRPGTSA
jgi:CheY-like chemotaxis protein